MEECKDTIDTILGIDLGTTNSSVSIIRDGHAVVLEDDGRKSLPSIVGLDAQGKLLVGVPALNQWVLAPDRTVRSIKRKMGSSETVQMGDRTFTPQEISAIILRTLREQASDQLGWDVHRAVITVPAFFTEQQREATREAGELAGLEVVRIINEPTAASLTYNASQEGLERLLVYDLGGGTFDVSVVQVEQGVVEVLSSHGDTRLGGDDFDELLLNDVCDKFEKEYDVDLRESLGSKSRVLRAVEAAKKQLSFDAFATIEEEFIVEKAGVPLHLKMELARSDYESLIEPLLSKTLVCVDEALSDAKLAANQIDRVILVGGASRTPLVRGLLTEQLGQPIHSEIDPDLCVSMGAAIQGGLINGMDLGPVLIDITPHTLGIQCRGFLFGFDSGYSLAPLIHRNTALPASRSEAFRTVNDGQDAVCVTVFQGENDDVRHNTCVGEFRLEGLADVKAGNEILVRFDLDIDGILKVSATEKATKLEQALTIDNAMSRFRDEDREEAQSRIDDAFESGLEPGMTAAARQDPMTENAMEELSPELQQAIAKANELLSKSEQLSGDAAAADLEEMARLAERLASSIVKQSLEEIESHTAALDDVVFYLQDV